ncbi:MAG TPA: pseudouridine synthase [Candidatus Saccharimonadales bacterium]|nr:pseudouridine synthase [Candidatus Saccharimonadales bacterium]
MRLNHFIAQASGLSRRAADRAIAEGQVLVNGHPAVLGQDITDANSVTLNQRKLVLPKTTTIVIFNKPIGYVSSRDGQGSKTIYDLLPLELHSLKPVGRLDKDSSGLLLLTDNGQLAHELTHPRFYKEKVYEIELDKSLEPEDQVKIEAGIQLDDGLSKLKLKKLPSKQAWQVTMHEGRNRQIRRTFTALGYNIAKLHRVKFGNYELGRLKQGQLLRVFSYVSIVAEIAR